MVMCWICRTVQDGNPGDDCRFEHWRAGLEYYGSLIAYDPKGCAACPNCGRYAFNPKKNLCARCGDLTQRTYAMQSIQLHVSDWDRYRLSTARYAQLLTAPIEP